MASKNKFLKFSFYGRSAVGKTSMLAALDMPRVGMDNKGGKIVPLENVKITGDGLEDNEASQLLRGHAAVATAVRELTNPRNGKAHPTGRDDKVMQIRCEFPSSTIEGVRHNVVLYEYAGEILESAELNNKESLLQNLHKMLGDRDAFFVVVEAPISKARIADFTEDMHKLMKAFSAIRKKKGAKGRLHIPVLMLITKWDRYEPNPFLETQDKRLEQFFKDYPTFESVRHDLASGVEKDMFKVFPVSALGKVENDGTDNSKCKFVDGALNSYGLEQPFIWAAEKVKTKNTQAFHRYSLLALSGAAVLLLSFSLIDAVLWNHAYRVAKTKAEIPTGDPNDYTNLLSGYVESSWYKNLLLKATGYSKEDASEELINFERKPQEIAWSKIVSEPDPISKMKQAQDFIEKWPRGIYSAECKNIVDKGSIDSDNSEVARISTRVNGSLESASGVELSSLILEVEDVQKQLNNPEQFTTPLKLLTTQIDQQIRLRKSDIDRESFESLQAKVESEMQVKDKSRLEDWLVKTSQMEATLNFPQEYLLQVNNLKERIRDRIEGIEIDAKQEKFKSQVVAEIDAKNFLEAGDLLSTRSQAENDRGWLEPVVSIFRHQLLIGHKQKLSDFALNKQWEKGNDYIEKLKTRMTSWHGDLKSEEIFKAVRSSQLEFNKAHDRNLYQQVIDSPTTINVTRYLEKAPLQTMAQWVKEYQDWVRRIPSGDQEYYFTLTGIVWDASAYPRPNNRVEVWCADQKIINIENVNSAPSETTNIVPKAENRIVWNPNKNDKIKVRVKVFCYSYFDFVHGDGHDEFKLDLEDGELELPSEGYGTQKAKFKIEPVDSKPKLPPWRAL